MTTHSISLESMAMQPFCPSPEAMNGYLRSLRSMLEIVPEVYTPCYSDNVAYIGRFLADHGMNYSADTHGVTIYR